MSSWPFMPSGPITMVRNSAGELRPDITLPKDYVPFGLVQAKDAFHEQSATPQLTTRQSLEKLQRSTNGFFAFLEGCLAEEETAEYEVGSVGYLAKERWRLVAPGIEIREYFKSLWISLGLEARAEMYERCWHQLWGGPMELIFQISDAYEKKGPLKKPKTKKKKGKKLYTDLRTEVDEKRLEPVVE